MPNSYEDRVLRVLDHIYDHPAGDLSLDRLAEVASMSRFHWHRVFRALTGETCAQATRRIRMARAAVWLVQTDLPITEIARRCGYGHAQSFTRLFGEQFGLTPAAFRARGETRALTHVLREGVARMHDVTILDRPALRLAALSHTGAYPEIGRTFEKLSAILVARDLIGRTRGMAGVYYDDPSSVPADELRSHAGAVVGDDLEMPEPLEDVRLPAGRHAVLRFKGHYAGLPAAYDELYCAWLPKSGEEPADRAAFEVYLNSPLEVAPEDLLTDICVPLR